MRVPAKDRFFDDVFHIFNQSDTRTIKWRVWDSLLGNTEKEGDTLLNYYHFELLFEIVKVQGTIRTDGRDLLHTWAEL